MRKILTLIIHCSDSDHPHHDNIEAIRRWHVKERGWRDIGYHGVITKDGMYHEGRSVEIVGAHCKHFNKHSVGICLTGKDLFSQQQLHTLYDTVQTYKEHYPGIEICYHKDLTTGKSCPNIPKLDWR